MSISDKVKQPSECKTNRLSLFHSAEECCGCTACYSICPTHAIQMKADDEGFLYPSINEKLCIGCHLCEKVCAFKQDGKNKVYMGNPCTEPLHTYAVRHCSEEVRMQSRSGGIFTAISDDVLGKDGIVYGCVLDDNFMAHHVRATCAAQRDAMRGSKYIQSDLDDTYHEIQEDLNKNKIVLFSGTSCQVAGLRSFLKKDYSNLLCIDIVCHGMPSPLVWRKYLDWQEEKNHGKAINVDFRGKYEFGWRAPIETLYLEKKGKRAGSGKIRLKNDVLSRPMPKHYMNPEDRTDIIVYSDVFTNLFYDHCILRPSCYQCPYKSLIHPGDITIGDYWGINLVCAAHLDDDKGVSLVMTNTEKGQHALELVHGEIVVEETGVSEPMLQEPLRRAFPCPKNRKQFWEDFHTLPFKKIVSKYANHGWIKNIRLWMGCRKRMFFLAMKR